MFARCVVTACLLAAWPAMGEPNIHSKDGDDSVRIRNGDAAMIAAKQKARASLKDFLALVDHPRDGTRNFSVKIGLPIGGDDYEYIWIRPFERDGERFVGRLVNTPLHFTNIKYGDRLIFHEKDIADWSYLEGDRTIGNFTACAIVANEPPEARQTFMQRYHLSCEFSH